MLIKEVSGPMPDGIQKTRFFNIAKKQVRYIS